MTSSMIVLFALCSFVGWIWESLYAIVTKGRWENRGFLYGPVCPIYGVGVVAIVLAVKSATVFLDLENGWMYIAAFAFFGSMILEYVVSWGLEKLFHAYWWDYSSMPLNINGRTCIPAAFLFMLGGLAAVYLIAPAWDAAVARIPFDVIEIAAYLAVIVITADTTLTVSALTDFQARVTGAEKAFNKRAEELTDKVTSIGPEAAEWMRGERERLKELDIQDLVDGMSGGTRMALRRIEGFRLPERKTWFEFSELRTRALEHVKSRRK